MCKHPPVAFNQQCGSSYHPCTAHEAGCFGGRCSTMAESHCSMRVRLRRVKKNKKKTHLLAWIIDTPFKLELHFQSKMSKSEASFVESGVLELCFGSCSWWNGSYAAAERFHQWGTRKPEDNLVNSVGPEAFLKSICWLGNIDLKVLLCKLQYAALICCFFNFGHNH